METYQHYFRRKNEFFVNLGTNTTKHLNNNVNYQQYVKSHSAQSIFFNPTTESEIFNIISSLKNKTSAGYDNTSTKLIKSIAKPISKHLSDFSLTN